MDISIYAIVMLLAMDIFLVPAMLLAMLRAVAVMQPVIFLVRVFVFVLFRVMERLVHAMQLVMDM
jgi:hypothetical protein